MSLAHVHSAGHGGGDSSSSSSSSSSSKSGGGTSHVPGRVLERIGRDIADLKANGFRVVGPNGEEPWDEQSFKEFGVWMRGPSETPYAGGHFLVALQLALAPRLEDSYPFKSPSVRFVTPIFHPNIQMPGGSVCVDNLRDAAPYVAPPQPPTTAAATATAAAATRAPMRPMHSMLQGDAWKPAMRLTYVFEGILPMLLRNPEPSSPLNVVAGSMVLASREAAGRIQALRGLLDAQLKSHKRATPIDASVVLAEERLLRAQRMATVFDRIVAARVARYACDMETAKNSSVRSEDNFVDMKHASHPPEYDTEDEDDDDTDEESDGSDEEDDDVFGTASRRRSNFAAAAEAAERALTELVGRRGQHQLVPRPPAAPTAAAPTAAAPTAAAPTAATQRTVEAAAAAALSSLVPESVVGQRRRRDEATEAEVDARDDARLSSSGGRQRIRLS
jgi:ubiquitin-protein ligase